MPDATVVLNEEEIVLALQAVRDYSDRLNDAARYRRALSETVRREIQLASRATRLAPVVIEFDRLSDWYGDTETEIVTALTTDPQAIAITNDGTADARAITFVLEAGGASGFDGPSVSHALTGETWASTRTAAGALDQLRVNTGAYTVEYSDDDGASWSDDYALFSTGSVQVGFMRFLPGAQSIEVSGCTNATLTISFYPAFR